MDWELDLDSNPPAAKVIDASSKLAWSLPPDKVTPLSETALSPVGPFSEALLEEFHLDPEVPMDEVDREILSYVTERFYLSGAIPTVEKIQLACKVPRIAVKRAFAKNEFQGKLINLGVAEADTETALSPEQVMCVNAILNTFDKTSQREKLKALNISTQKFNGWKAQPAFQKYMRERAEKLFGSADVDARLAIVKGVQSNDLGFVKLYGEMTGLYNPKVQVEVNVNLILTRVVEVLTKYVPADVLLAVSEELAALSPTPLSIGA